ncbi:MAG: ABC transporter ATP-binding protein [Gemmatimonadota bacterium]
MPAVELVGVEKRFGATRAVRGLDLRIPRGSTYGLLGPNGSGKTTTIRMLLRILEPDAGTLRVFGGDVTPAALDRIGYLPEERGLYARMTARNVLAFLAELKGVPPRVSRPRIDAWLERMGLADRADARVQEYSKGMQQKLQFLAAIIHQPDLVILDEPFSGLDPINQEVLKEIIAELRTQGRTILFCTHMIEHAERLCDHVCIIARGQVLVDGPVATVRRAHGGSHVALTLAELGSGAAARVRASAQVGAVQEDGGELHVSLRPEGDPQALLAELVAAGVGLRRFEIVEPTLRQIFLDRAAEAPGLADVADAVQANA